MPAAPFTPPLFPAHPDPIRKWRTLTPERIALVDRDRGERYSYAELDALADRLAGALRMQGVRRGDRVGIIAGNRVEHVAALFACGRIGAALVPFDGRLAAAELAPVIDHADVQIVLGEEQYRATAAEAFAAVDVSPRWIDLDHDLPALLRRGFAPTSDVPLEPESAALVLYASERTGKPAGAVLPHRQIFWNAVATTTAWQLGADGVAPVGTSFCSTDAWNVFATPLWHRGGRVVLCDASDPSDYLDALAEEGCTVASTAPAQLATLAGCARWGRELPAMRTFVSCGAPLPIALAGQAREAGYRIREGYGLTECGPNCFAISEREALARAGSVGWPIHFLEMRLVDTSGDDVATGEVGELLLRGPQMFGGYLHDAERTADALAPGGWLRTGDLATRDADGAYRILGRKEERVTAGDRALREQRRG